MLGDRFGRFVIVGEAAPQIEMRYGRKFSRKQWLCRCVCGVEKVVRQDSLKRGFSQSCGCLHRDVHTKHGHYAGDQATPTYQSWSSMRGRCLTETDEHYPEYGGRGIKVCERWDKFENFLEDMGERPKGKTLDRKDVNGHYTPENCRWATTSEQGRNRRNTVFVTYRGERLPLIDVCEMLGKPYDYAVRRLKINKAPSWMAEECVLV